MKMRYCFILGCSGSGKSVLAKSVRCLDSTLFATETVLPTCLAHLVNQPIDRTVREVLEIGVANHLAAYAQSGDQSSRLDAAMKFFRSNLSFSEFRSALGRRRSFDLLCLESNFFSLAPEFLAGAIPDALWLFVVRDGRDCADGLVRNYRMFADDRLLNLTHMEMPIGRKVDHRFVPWWVENGREQEFLAASPFGRSLWMWKATVQKGQDWISKNSTAGSERVLLVKYEEFVTKPVETGERISALLRKPLNRPAIQHLKSIHSRFVGQYKARPRHELEEAGRIVGSELRLFGYV